MNRRKTPRRLFWGLAMMLLLVACGSPVATPTPAPSPEPAIELGEVVFDGTECVYSGLSEVTPGWYSLVYHDLSDLGIDVFVSRLADGKTYQDYLDLQMDPNDPCQYFPQPDWVDSAVEPGSAQLRTDGGEVHTYIFVTPRTYAIVVGRESPFCAWNCAPLTVVETPSE